MKKTSFLLLLIILFSCKKTDDDHLIIKAGFACGWGAGEDSLEITGSEIKYVYWVPSQSTKPLINETRAITKSEWDEIENTINIDSFSKLDYNSCNLCFDGCDEWISIHNDGTDYQIRYSMGLKIESIAKLQEIIDRIKAEFH